MLVCEQWEAPDAMKEKYVCVYRTSTAGVGGSAEREKTESLIQECRMHHAQVRGILHGYKNKITQHSRNHVWDDMKKYGNEYEHHSQWVSKYPLPVSRSYYKLWEILHDVEFARTYACESLRSCHIAEGPGGFMESFVDYCQVHGRALDAVHGITLCSSDRRVPSWKLSPSFQRQHRVHLSGGKDGTGDIYQVSNADFFIRETGYASCSLVTGDGGFDFSRDFNNQERNFLQLLVSEIYIAVHVQKQGGTFVLKIFDMFEDSTVQILWVLSTFYETLSFTKPHTSRPANGERYVVCQGFRVPTTRGVSSADSYRLLRIWMKQGYSNTHWLGEHLSIPASFWSMVAEVNTVYAYMQIQAIHRTFFFIHLRTYHARWQVLMEAIYQQQLACSYEWCVHYGIPIRVQASEITPREVSHTS